MGLVLLAGGIAWLRAMVVVGEIVKGLSLGIEFVDVDIDTDLGGYDTMELRDIITKPMVEPHNLILDGRMCQCADMKGTPPLNLDSENRQ